jgi:hypothetical protein
MIKVTIHSKDEVNHMNELHLPSHHQNFAVHHLQNNQNVKQSLKPLHQSVDLNRLQSFRIPGIVKIDAKTILRYESQSSCEIIRNDALHDSHNSIGKPRAQLNHVHKASVVINSS